MLRSVCLFGNKLEVHAKPENNHAI